MDNDFNYNSTPESSPHPQTPKTPPASRRISSVLLAAFLLALLGGALGASGMMLLQQNSTQLSSPNSSSQNNISHILQGQRENSVIDIINIDTSKIMTPAEVYAANVNSTVGITTSITTNYWGYPSTSAASGSGFIISNDGYILTNYHVIENSNSITVSTYDEKAYTATLIGYDESNDIAVLKIDAKNLTPVILGDSDNLNVGDSVIAIGNPLGELTFTLTAGTISAKDRKVTFSNHVTMNLMQTDCAINSGNSGGALFNLYGEVIGVTNAKYSGSSGSGSSIDNIGFAIPVNNILNIVKSIIEKGYITKPYVGISVADVSEEAQQFGIPAGAAVQSVTQDSPAADAGLKKGDVITAANSQPMTSSKLVDLVEKSNPGDTITLSVYRQGQTLNLKITVGEQIQNATTSNSGNRSQDMAP